MEIKRDTLSTALKKLAPGLSPKELVEQMTQFNFLGNNLVTYNEIVSVFVPFESDFVCSVKADVFQGIIEKLGEDSMELKLVDDEYEDTETGKKKKRYFLDLKAKNTEAQFPVIIEGDITKAMKELETEIVDADWLECSPDFCTGAYICMFAASKDPSNNTLTCIKVDDIDLVACDNARATWYRMMKPMETFLIQATVAKELKKYQPTHYKVGKNWIHFKNEDGVIFNARRVRGDMRPVKPFFEKEGTDFKIPPELKQAIDLAGVVNADANIAERLVELSISEGSAICSAWKKDGAKVKKTVPIPFYTGGEISFFINPDFMMEIIQHSEKDPKTGEKTPNLKINMEKRMAFFLNAKFDHALLLRAS
jgi:hypothetical protein